MVLVSGKVEFDQTRAVWGGAFALVTVCGLADLAGGRLGIHATIHALGDAGGWLGVGTGGALASWIGVAGSTIVLLALFVVAIIVVTGVGLRGLLRGNRHRLGGDGSSISRAGGPCDRVVTKSPRAKPRSRRSDQRRVRPVAYEPEPSL